MINVTKTFLPPIDEYMERLRAIWASGWLTNNGVCVQELEGKLRSFLESRNVLSIANGTIALQIAIRALGIEGEAITTPFSYVATASSLAWERCRPVFVDIDADSLNIDPQKIEAAITSKTTAIVATHVFGKPCDVDALDRIAKRHGLRVLYDGAHAFGVVHRGRPLLTYGDVSILSLHATKVFHTVEGGAVCTNDDEVAHRVSYMRNFGHDGHEAFQGLGINGKMSELHAAMGLCVLPHFGEIVRARGWVWSRYQEQLSDLAPKVIMPRIASDTIHNFSYFPVILESESAVLRTREALQRLEINPRRYFFPSLSTLPYASCDDTPIANDISRRILCLPMSHDVPREAIDLVCETIRHCTALPAQTAVAPS